MESIEMKRLYASADYKCLSEQERVIFKSVVSDMDSRGLFKMTDAPLVALYARNMVLAREASKAVAKTGVLVEETDNYHGTKVRENPAIQTMLKAQKAAQELGVLLGLTPVGRKRTKTEEKPENDPLDAFLNE